MKTLFKKKHEAYEYHMRQDLEYEQEGQRMLLFIIAGMSYILYEVIRSL